MKINRNAWHMNLVRWATSDTSYQPRNLCRHFWVVVGSFAYLLSILMVCVALAALVIVVLWHSPSIIRFLAAQVAGIMVFLSLYILVSVGFLLGKLSAVIALHGSPAKNQSGQPKHPGLLRSWLAAKKRKICPLIEVED